MREARGLEEEVERRRVPRVNLAHEQFRLSANGRLFWVTDLSTGGFGIRVPEQEDLIHFTMGKRVEGVLNLHGTKIEVRAQVLHVGRSSAGLRFEELVSEQTTVLERFLDPSHLAHELVRMPAPEETLVWFHGPSGTDVLVWQPTEHGQFSRALVMLRGHYLEWEEGKLATGTYTHSQEPSDERGAMRLETLLFQRDSSSPHPDKKAVAKKFLLSSNLPEPLKISLISAL